MAIVRHENFELDLKEASRGKLYRDGRLIFMGDAYRAITILIKNCNTPGPVQERFKAISTYYSQKIYSKSYKRYKSSK